jgi:uncharacterized damage-inducible protein DinB
MTAQEYLSGVCRYMGSALSRTVSHVPEEKYSWSPMGEARPVWDMLLECACILEAAKDWIEQGEMKFEAYFAEREQAKADPPALPALLERLNAAAEAYAKAIESLSDEQAEQEIQNPMTGRPAPFIRAASMPIMNMVYHFGQVNYIQTMLGDMEMH